MRRLGAATLFISACIACISAANAATGAATAVMRWTPPAGTHPRAGAPVPPSTPSSGLCGYTLAQSASHPDAPVITVAAASSLKEAFDEIGAAFRSESGPVEFNFAGSQILRTQIEQGASVDVIALADSTHAFALLKENLIEPPNVFAHGRLTIVTPARSERVQSVRDLARRGLRIVLGDLSVPVGRYTAMMLNRVAADSALGPSVRRKIESNVVSREINVRAVLAKVALGEADAGIVYVTDLEAARDKVRSVEIPAGINALAEYFIAVRARGPHPAQATAFVNFVTGPAGRAILRRHGFQD